MAMDIVDRFEAVEIEIQESDVVVTLLARRLAINFSKSSPVGQPRQRVVARKMGNLVGAFHKLDLARL